MKLARRQVLQLGGGALLPWPGCATPGRGAMRTAGLSRARLDRMHQVMADHAEHGVPGIITLVARRGDVHVDVIGNKTVAGPPLRRDDIFRISSMTKPLIAAAAMVLVEDCKLRLDEPVDRLLPELADRKVLKRIDGPLDDTVPARRPITVGDLLTFRLGFGQILGPPSYPIHQAERALQLMSMGPPMPATPHAPDEWMRRFGTLPLMRHPGEAWMYNTAAQILGVLIARAARQPLEAFLRERLFEPLGMKDTGFSVPASKRDRLVACYHANPGTGALDLQDGVADSQWSHPPIFPDGGAGLVSTVDDYFAFGQMLLEGGRRGHAQVLSRLSVEAMTTNQLTAEQMTDPEVSGFLGPDRGWGLGMAVFTRRDGVAAVPGRFGWDGGFGTSWSSDPKEGLVGILLTTRTWDSPSGPAVFHDFWTLAYQAVE
jgi:CubicO group peptidase (beta-lactamase class C family)